MHLLLCWIGWTTAVMASGSGVVINEIMFAPSGGGPEWVEILNAGEAPVSLSGWSLHDATGTRHAIPPFLLSPHGFAVLTGSAAALHATWEIPASQVVEVPGFPSLNNEGDAVVLCDASGYGADSVRYRGTWGGSPAGRSIERKDAAWSSTDSATWAPSTAPSGATPGLPNANRRLAHDLSLSLAAQEWGAGSLSLTAHVTNRGSESVTGAICELRMPGDSSLIPSDVPLARAPVGPLAAGDSADALLVWRAARPGISPLLLLLADPADERSADNRLLFTPGVPWAGMSVVINEIMPRPVPGCAEYVELFNATADTIDLRGWRLHDGSAGADLAGRGIIAESSLRFPPLSWAVVADDSMLLPGVSAGSLRAVPVAVRHTGLGLNDQGDAVVLHDPTGAMIDSVEYADTWHNAMVTDPVGRSLERVSAEAGSQLPANWATCVAAGGGTPGGRNSVAVRFRTTSATLAAAPNPFSPDGDGRDDVTLVTYHLPPGAAAILLSVYDLRGRRVRIVADHALAASEGVLVWNGLADDGERVPIGPYILFLQAIGTDGGPAVEAAAVVIVARPL